MKFGVIAVFLFFWMFTTAEASSTEDKISSDTTKNSIATGIIKSKERIGQNGFAFHILNVNQHIMNGKKDPRTTAGLGISGDILTGVPFIHLLPAMKYWSYSYMRTIPDTVTRTAEITERAMSFHFNAAFMSDRFSGKLLRVFAGIGPSMHIDIQTISETVNTSLYGETVSGVRSGLGVFAGIEWPFSVYSSLIITGSYIRTYEWDKIDRIMTSLSIGLAI